MSSKRRTKWSLGGAAVLLIVLAATPRGSSEQPPDAQVPRPVHCFCTHCGHDFDVEATVFNAGRLQRPAPSGGPR